MSETESAHIVRVDVERKHLEGLFKDRINFHIVFASVFMAGLSGIDNPKVRVAASGTVTIVSFLIGWAVLRTHRLVYLALEEIKTDEHHPYYRYQKEVRVPGNANNTLVLVPFILTAFFLGLTIFYFCRL
jgi:hypothetical protein